MDEHRQLEDGLLTAHEEKMALSQDSQSTQPPTQRRGYRAWKFIASFLLCYIMLYTFAPLFITTQESWWHCSHGQKAVSEVVGEEDMVSAGTPENFLAKIEKRQEDANATLPAPSEDAPVPVNPPSDSTVPSVPAVPTDPSVPPAPTTTVAPPPLVTTTGEFLKPLSLCGI